MSETWLGQIYHNGQWMDYARGTEADSRHWWAKDPNNRRVVDWIRKKTILVPSMEEQVGRFVEMRGSTMQTDRFIKEESYQALAGESFCWECGDWHERNEEHSMIAESAAEPAPGERL